MNKLFTLIFGITLVQACSNGDIVQPKEITKNECIKVELKEAGMRLFLPAEFAETNALYRYNAKMPSDSSQTPKEILEAQAMMSRFFALNGDTTQLLYLLYGHGAPEVEITKATAGVISAYLKESSIRSSYMQGYSVRYGKSELSILPKVSFLKLNGTYSVFGTSEKGVLNLVMLSSKHNSVMMLLRTKKEIQIEKYLALTEIL